MLMRVMRLIVALLTVIVTIVFVTMFTYVNISKDKTIPVITMETEQIDVSVKATDEELLQGVTAFDEKDGDISSRLLVESISKFTTVGYAKMKYVVTDLDNHVVTATRVVHYTDYTPPKFTMNSSLVFSVYEEIVTKGIIGATDAIDGDISKNIILYSPDYEEGKEGDYTIQATVTNSKGDTSIISLPMSVERIAREAPEIILHNYLIYIKKGDSVDYSKYIKQTIDSYGVETDLKIQVQTDFVKNKEGMFTVDYYGTDSYGRKGHTALIVIAE